MSDETQVDPPEGAAANVADPDATPTDGAPAEVSDVLEVGDAHDDVAFRVMRFDSVLYDLTDPTPMVHLLEAASPFRYLVIPVALADAIAIQHAHAKIEGRRPATHELMTTILTRLQAEVIAARIVRYEGGVFYAELDLMTPRGREVLDCRTSDAIALALRQQATAPILCSDEVMQRYYA
jgi:bifunctional DNase/RNase